MLRAALSIVALLVAGRATAAVSQAAGRDVARVYGEVCVTCHGSGFAGGKAQSLLDDVWAFGGDDSSLATTIRDGRAAAGMPAFASLLTEPEIRAMVFFLREQRVKLRAVLAAVRQPPHTLDVQSEKQAFRIETVVDGLDTPWGLAFLPDGRLLVSERPGRLRVIELGHPLPAPIDGTPVVWAVQDGGLMDVEPHPDYAHNGWVYLAYADPGDPPTSSNAKAASCARATKTSSSASTATSPKGHSTPTCGRRWRAKRASSRR